MKITLSILAFALLAIVPVHAQTSKPKHKPVIKKKHVQPKSYGQGLPKLAHPSSSSPSRQARGYESKKSLSSPPPDKRTPPGY